MISKCYLNAIVEPQDLNQPIHRNFASGLVMIFRFCW